MYARLTGTGSYLPGTAVSNDDLAARGIDSNDEWIVSRTGIRSRFLAAPETTSSELGLVAAQRALDMAGVAASDIDLIIVATSTPDFIFPSTACLIQGRLGSSKGAAAFDVQAVCSGFVYALGIAEKFIRSGSHSRALVIGAEVLNGILNVPGQVCGGQVTGDPFLRMDGQAVFKFAVRVLAEVAEEVCVDAGIPTNAVDWLIPHQANIRIMEATAKKLGVERDRVIITVDRHGNTSAASVPLALDEAVRDGRIRRGQRVLLEGVGGGFTWGAALLEF